MWTKAYWKAVGERALRTFAQSAASNLATMSMGALAAGWKGLVAAATIAAAMSVLMSIAAAEVTNGSPSMVDSEVIQDPSPTPDEEYEEPQGE